MKISTLAKRSILGLVGAVAITASIAAPTLADNSVTQVITSNGTFSSSIANASMTAISYSDTQVTTTGSLTMSVSDGRGTAEGWNVTVASTNFVYGGSSPIGQAIPNTGFSITATNDPVYVSGQPIQATGPVKVTSGAASLNTARETIQAAAGTGSGSYTQTLPVSLVVPAYSQAGTYTAPLTVTRTPGTWSRAHQWFLPCLLALLVAATALSPLRAAAAALQESDGAPAFLIEPVGDDQEGAYFVLELEPGERETLTIALGNAGTGAAPARTYAADVFSLVNGGFGINPESEPRTGTTTWLDYEAESLDIPPGRMLEREFTVTVPDDAEPGQHITGIVIQTAEPIAIGDSEMLRQNIVKAVAVFITVPGKLTPKLEIGDASLKQGTGSNSLIVEVANAGNVLLKPEGTLSLTTVDGEAVLSSPIEMGSVYAGMATVLELPIPTVVAPGEYLVDVTLKDPETGAKDRAKGLPVTSADLAAATPAALPIRIDAVAAAPVLDPATGSLQVVNVAVSLVNEGGPLNGARLTLHVERDGELVEDFPLSSSLVVPSGTTEIAQRYVPLGRWEPGTYAFSATLEATDLSTGQVTLLDTADAASPVVVP